MSTEPRPCRVYIGETCISECAVACRRLLDIDIAQEEDDEAYWFDGDIRIGILRFFNEEP